MAGTREPMVAQRAVAAGETGRGTRRPSGRASWREVRPYIRVAVAREKVWEETWQIRPDGVCRTHEPSAKGRRRQMSWRER